MAEGNEPRPYVPSEIVTNKISLSCTKGNFSQYTAVKTGNLISLAFVLTLTTGIAANEEIVITPTFSDDRLKPIQRSQIGGSNQANTNTFNLTAEYLSARLANAYNVGSPFWLHFMYICSD